MSHTFDETMEERDGITPRRAPPRPGLVLVFCAGAPTLLPVPLGARGATLGREWLSEHGLRDGWCSRQHVRVWLEGGEVLAQDLASRNGVSVDGQRRAHPDAPAPVRRALRLGQSVALVVPDVGLFEEGAVRVEEGSVVGPRLAAALRELEALARGSRSLFVQGESGAGKELAARRFHRAREQGNAPFVAVNCAAVPESLAERLLFGARKGAYSGSTEDAEGYFQTAHGGTLFLDEVAELDASVQAKLLRVLETGEVLPLGAARPLKTDVRVVAASLDPLDRAVAQGRFRADLYYRLGQPSVRVPPLRERLEEVPFLLRLAAEAQGYAQALDARFVEQCLLRAWPGNVRELLTAARRAMQLAALSGALELDPPAETAAPLEPAVLEAPRGAPSPEAIAAALQAHGGNVSAAARALGLHRTQLRRLLARAETPGDE